MDEISEVFHIPARLCKRCGVLLTSEQALLEKDVPFPLEVRRAT